MQLRNQGTAFLPEGGALPGGSYPVYPELDIDQDGAVTGEVHFAGEPKYPRPIAIGKDFEVYIPHPMSITGENVILTIRFVDNSGAVSGYVHGSRAQFHPPSGTYSKMKGKILRALAKHWIAGRSTVVHFEFTGGPDDGLEKQVLAELRAEGFIEQEVPTVARFTSAGYNKYKDIVEADEDPASGRGFNSQGLAVELGGDKTKDLDQSSSSSHGATSPSFNPPAERTMAKKHVFLSYCHDNSDEVTRLREELIAAGEAVWWDQNIKPGQDWKLEIRKAMKNAYAVVLCLSKETEGRKTSGIYPEALDAIGAYREYAPGSIFLIPVRLSACEIPPIEIDGTRMLDRLQYADLFPTKNRIAGIKKLLDAIQAAAHHP
ncbi:MAG: toll/interleukin-1 receptor domain-containing protein [Acidobacteriia bacterium]|nr:toll/interleukin-1 receptor domain-containing protein [Terriglobia bacterium]